MAADKDHPAIEIVNDSCGILVPPGDAINQFAALCELINDEGLWEMLEEPGIARAHEFCDAATQIVKLCEITDSVLKGSIYV